MGIIGRNGAGKSTLLKVLTRITEPTTGRFGLRGRVSLLEVGTGFHPELTGRENIFLNGAILGMTRREIQRKFDEIVAFSEIERFLDTPVKRYSSGMYVRLAFAVAAHLEPEILIVDEVLAVGDAGFQKKCLTRMRELASSGRTVILVSHHLPSVVNLCSRAILLDAGRVVAEGAAAEVIQKYIAAAGAAVGEVVWSDRAAAPGNDAVRLHAIRVLQGGTLARPQTWRFPRRWPSRSRIGTSGRTSLCTAPCGSRTSMERPCSPPLPPDQPARRKMPGPGVPTRRLVPVRLPLSGEFSE